MGVALLIYAAGVVTALLFTDARPLTRVGLALAWPIGPLAFVVVVTGLLLVALYLFPVFAVVTAAGALAVWWLLA